MLPDANAKNIGIRMRQMINKQQQYHVTLKLRNNKVITSKIYALNEHEKDHAVNQLARTYKAEIVNVVPV